MRNYFLSVCRRLGMPPRIWMFHNPMKIYEYLAVVENVDLQSTDIILDLGCGQGIWTADLARRCKRAIGVDISKVAISGALRYIRNSFLKKRLEYHAKKLEDLNFKADALDHIFSFCVLEHIQDLSKVLLEAKRILKPGGHLHVSVDSLETIHDSELKIKHKHDHYVHEYFTIESLRKKLTEAGFNVETIFPILKGEFAKQEFIKRVSRQNYHYNWLACREIVDRFKMEDLKEDCLEGVLIVAHASV